MSGTTNIPAVALVVRRGDKLLFMKRLHTGFQDGRYCLPAGHVEAGESFRTAGVRELKEEAGLDVSAESLRHVHTQHSIRVGSNIRIHVFFEVDDYVGVPQNMEPHLHSDWVWLPADDLPYDEIVDFMAFALKAVDNGKSYEEIGWIEPLTN